jgi:hypothetical protein
MELELTINSFKFQLSGAAGREKIADLELAAADVQPAFLHFYLRPLQDIQLFSNHNGTTRSRRQIGTFELGVAATCKRRRWARRQEGQWPPKQ